MISIETHFAVTEASSRNLNSKPYETTAGSASH